MRPAPPIGAIGPARPPRGSDVGDTPGSGRSMGEEPLPPPQQLQLTPRSNRLLTAAALQKQAGRVGASASHPDSPVQFQVDEDAAQAPVSSEALEPGSAPGSGPQSRGAAPRLGCPQTGQGAVQALPPARNCPGSGPASERGRPCRPITRGLSTVPPKSWAISIIFKLPTIFSRVPNLAPTEE